MAEKNIVRKDVVQISFETDSGSLSKATKQIDDFKKSVTSEVDKGLNKIKQSVSDVNKATKSIGKGGGLDDLAKSTSKITKEFQSVNKSIKSGGSALTKFKDNVKAAKSALTEGQTGAKGFGNALKNIGKSGVSKALSGIDSIKTKLQQSVPNADKLKDKLKGVGDKLTDIGKKAAGAAYSGLKKIAGMSFKAVAAGVGAAATAVGGIAYKAVQSYANYEQLVGGVETLFKDSSSIVQTYANDAYKTAGLSANDYMETVTSFSASLLQGLKGDTKKAAEYGNMAVIDMADNANKMGTDIAMIQNAYQGFAKQNYTMLDNLKLGYGGTKSEMERLVKEASNMKEVQEKLGVTVDGTSMSFDNIVKAIHVVQANMDIMGTTSKEAEHTVQGSLFAMKSAWGNLLTAIGSGENMDQCFENMISSAEIFADNLLPVVERALGGIGTLVERLAPKLSEEFPKLAQKIIPPLIKSAVTMAKSLMTALPSIVKTVATTIVDIAGQQFPIIKKIGAFFVDNAGKVADTIKKVIIPAVLALIAAFKGFKALSFIKSLFGSKTGGGGLFSGITSMFKGLAETDTKTVLKGMLNLTIILGGLGALVWAATKVFKDGVDFTQMLKVVGLIGILGLVGSALGKLGAIVGAIPVAIVAKGLANMAIMLGGMGALLWIATKVFANGINFTQMLQVTALIGILGIVGGALSVFAGIVGLIPIPVVLSGLANMALVLGGMTAIIEAFGLLSQIPGFNKFLEAGGEVLVKICDIIGQMAGSLVGGAIKQISEALPVLGENIGKFGEGIKPLFSAMQGVNMEGVGTFFTALIGLLGVATGKDIIDGIKSFFGGGDESALSKLGTDLTQFATNAKGFFATVSELPENGFTNASKLFKSLADVGNVPNTGGIAQWFSGENDFSSLATGLKSLSKEGVLNFYRKVAELPENGFKNAKKFFKSLSDIGNIPNAGGVAQLFSGENDFAGLAKGLKQLSGEGVVRFFTTYGAMDASVFSNVKSFFKALGELDNLPKVNGLFGKGGNIANLGLALTAFSKNAKPFFEQVNSLNVENLNRLWNSLAKPGEIATGSLQVVSKTINEIIKKTKDLPKKMGEGIKSSGKSLASALSSVWKQAVLASVAPVNKVIDGANWILKEFSSSKRVATWKPYANGTDGHRGGNAVVNDGKGAELVQMPNGYTFIPKGRNVLLPNAPKGMKVLPAEQTASLMGRKSPTFRYADGTGDFDIFSYIDNPKGLIDHMKKKFVTYEGMSRFPLNAGKAMVTTITGQMVSWVKKLFDEEGGMSLASYVAGKGVEQWRSTVIRALKMEGLYSEANVKRTLYQMQTESGGNPRAINLWDSNAKAGIPSKGLMQVIDPTFQAYARPGFNKNIYDPLSNILAAIRYAVSRYGSLANAFQGHGYENGGIANKPSIFGENGAEMAIPLSKDKKNRAFSLWNETGDILGVTPRTPESSPTSYQSTKYEDNSTYAPQFNLTISGSNEDRVMERKVKRWISEAMDEVFESMSRKNPRLQEV